VYICAAWILDEIYFVCVCMVCMYVCVRGCMCLYTCPYVKHANKIRNDVPCVCVCVRANVYVCMYVCEGYNTIELISFLFNQ
jgi:hypothetical protein